MDSRGRTLVANLAINILMKNTPQHLTASMKRSCSKVFGEAVPVAVGRRSVSHRFGRETPRYALWYRYSVRAHFSIFKPPTFLKNAPIRHQYTVNHQPYITDHRPPFVHIMLMIKPNPLHTRTPYVEDAHLAPLWDDPDRNNTLYR